MRRRTEECPGTELDGHSLEEWRSFKIIKIIALACMYQLVKFGDFTSCGSKDVFKNLPCLMY